MTDSHPSEEPRGQQAAGTPTGEERDTHGQGARDAGSPGSGSRSAASRVRDGSRRTAVLGAMFIATAFGVVLSMPKSYKPRHPVTLRLALLIFLLLIPFIPALLPVVSHGHPASTTDMGLLQSAGACIGFGTLAAFPALIGIRLLQRESELRLWPTIYAGVAAALGANIALQAHCPIVDTGHLVVGHAMLGIVYAVLAWLVVKATVR